MPCYARPHEEGPGMVKRQKGMRGKPQHKSLSGLASTKKARQRRRNTLGLASLNSVGRLWVIGVFSSCLVPGPE